MNGVILSLLLALLSSVNLSAASSKQQSLLPAGNVTGLIQSSVRNLNIKSPVWSPKLLPDQIINKKSYGRGRKKKGNNLKKLNKKMRKMLKKNPEPTFDPDFVIISDPPTPIYVQTFPANGSIPDDGCDSNSVKFEKDGKCYQLMGREPCGDPTEYVTVDPKTFKGRCTPRLCGRDKVFVVRTGLCHDIYDKSECTGGRRLYYSPYGDPVCDCPIGEYPYPNPRDDCVPLFTQGPCPYGQVLTIDSDDRLKCTLSLCSARQPSTSYPINEAVYYSRKSLNKKESSSSYEYNSNYASGLKVPTYYSSPYPSTPKQLVPTYDGKCLELGSSGHCSGGYNDGSQLLGYDILKNELECIDISDPWSPYYFSEEENQLIDSVYNQLYPEYDFFPISLVYNSIQHQNKVTYDDEDKKKKKKKKKTKTTVGYSKKSDFIRRQFSGRTISIPDNPPCRPGGGQGKCTSKLVPVQQTRRPTQAVKTVKPTNCGGNQFFNSETGSCQNRVG